MDHRIADPLLPTAERMPALATIRQMLKALIDALRRDHLTRLALMTRLPARLAHRALVRLPRRTPTLRPRPRRIRRRRHRTVPRIPPHPPLQLLNSLRHRQQSRHNGLPTLRRDRLRLRPSHACKIPFTTQEPCSTPRHPLNAYSCGALSGKYDAWCISPCDPTTTAAQAPNYAVFGTQATVYGASGFFNYLQAANVYIGDHEPPTATASGLPPGWVSDTGYQVTGSDTGVGVNSVSATGAQPWYSGCSVDPSNHCPANQTITGNTTNMAEGINNINANVSDVIGGGGHVFGGTVGQVKIDRSPPAVGLSGTLSDGAVISQDSTLNVDATDGSNDGNPADARSGVASIDITLDPGTPSSQQLEHVTQGACSGPGCPPSPPPACTAPDNCSLTAAYTYSVADATPGTHTLQVVSTDNLGHASAPQNTTFVVDTQNPNVGASGALWNADGQTITQNTDMAVDGWAAAGEGPGVQKIEISVDGNVVASISQSIGQCQTSDCSLTLPFTFDLSASYATDGDHNVDIVATSFGGLTASEHETVNVQHIASLPSQAMDLAGLQDNLGGQPNQRIDGAAAGDQAGRSVTDIGDINGDGLDDYLIGAPHAGLDTTGKALAGAAYVVYGNPSGIPQNLGQLTPQQGFRIDGQLPGDYAGTAVAAIGDVNGDGVPDFAVGAPASDGSLPALRAGKVYVIFGSKCSTAVTPDPACQASSTNANLDLGNVGTRGFVINGPGLPALQQNPLSPPAHFGAVIANHQSGASSTSADVNNDGLDDIVIGSPDEAPNNNPDAGSAYVVYGKADSAPESIDNGTYNGFRVDGSSAGAQLGASVSLAGETSGENQADVAVGAPGDNVPNPATGAPRSNAGTVYVVRGASAPASPGVIASSSLVDPAQSVGYAVYGANGDAIGNSVADIGDVNSDGLADIGIGGVAHSYVLYGREPSDDGAPTDPQDLSTLDSADGYAITPPSSASGQQATVSGVGDLNDDALPDIAVSYPASSSNGRSTNGAVYPILSDPTGALPAGIDLNQLPGQQGATVYGEQGSQTGTQVVAVDAASDGDTGIIIGAPTSGAGTAWVVPSIALDGVPEDTSTGGTAMAAHTNALARAARTTRRPKRHRCRPYGRDQIPTAVVCARRTFNNNIDKQRRRLAHGFNRDGLSVRPSRTLNARLLLDSQSGKRLINADSNPSSHPEARQVHGPGNQTHYAWPVRDSLDNPIAYLAQLPLINGDPAPGGKYSSRQFSLYDVHGQYYGTSGPGLPSTDPRTKKPGYQPPQLDLEGVGCESSIGLIKRDLLMVIKGDSIGAPYDLRGYMPRQAFPDYAWHLSNDRKRGDKDILRYRSQLSPADFTRKLEDTYYSPCTGYKHQYRKASGTQPKPGFTSERYLMSIGTAPYSNYIKGNGGRTLPDLTVLPDDTTNVKGGGITRAVISNAAVQVSEGDKINYADHNVPCNSHTRQVAAHWYWVNASPDSRRPIWAWFPKFEPTTEAC